MTRIADINARLATYNALTLEQLSNDNIELSEVEVKRLTVKEVRGLISLFHYSRLMPDSTKFVFGAIWRGQIIGVACFGMGTTKAQYTSLYPDIQRGEYAELTRLWCLHTAPKNIESYLVSRALKMLPKEIKLVVSYSDEGRGHYGIIYQATNWLYVGTTKTNKRAVDENGQEVGVRLLGIYRQRNPELADKSNNEIMKYLNFRYIEGTLKHKYVYLRGSKSVRKKMKKDINHLIQSYPKGDKRLYKTDIDLYKEYGTNEEAI